MPGVQSGEKLSTMEAFLNASNIAFGIGMLGVPYAFRLAGWSGLLISAVCLVLQLITFNMIGVELEIDKQLGELVPDFRTVAERASGPIFGAFIACLCIIDCFAWSAGQYILIGVNAPLCIPGITRHMSILLSSIIALLLEAIPGKFFAYIAGMSVLFPVAAFAALMSTGAVMEDIAGDPRLVPESSQSLLKSCSILMYFVGWSVYLPPIYNSVETRASFNKAVSYGGVVALLVAACSSMVAVYFFGDAIAKVPTENIGRDLHLHVIPGFESMDVVISAFVALKCLLTVNPGAKPIQQFIVGFLHVDKNSGRVSFGLAFVTHAALALVAYIFSDAIIALEATVGQLLYSWIAIIFPAFCYLRLAKPSLAARVGCGVLLGLGLALFVCGFVNLVYRVT